MNKIKVLLTATGCPGAATMIGALKRNHGDCDLSVVGVDMRDHAIGHFLCDSFHRVPASSSPDYINSLVEICKKEKPDVLFPQSSAEVIPISKNRKIFEDMGIPVVVSDVEALELCDDKSLTYKALDGRDVKLPEVCYPESLDEFIACAKDMGYPQRPICFKPAVGKGGRGFRILRDDIDKYDLLMNGRPINPYMNLDQVREVFDGRPFPKLLLMEYVEGEEVAVNVLAKKGRPILTVVNTRDDIVNSLAMLFVNLERPQLVKAGHEILEKILLDYCVNIQFRGDYLMEINPRVSTFVFQDNLNLPYISVLLALGIITDEEAAGYQNNLNGDMKSVRYYDQVFFAS